MHRYVIHNESKEKATFKSKEKKEREKREKKERRPRNSVHNHTINTGFEFVRCLLFVVVVVFFAVDVVLCVRIEYRHRRHFVYFFFFSTLLLFLF